MLLIRKAHLLVLKTLNKCFNSGNSAHRRFHQCTCLLVKLSPREVTEILRANEFSHEFNNPSNCIKSYDSNQLPANFPIEDTRSEAQCLLTRGTLFGVFDGHCGPACAQVIAKRLFEYICIGLLPNDLLQEYFTSLQGAEPLPLIKRYNENFEILTELKTLYRKSLLKYTENVISNRKENFCMKKVLERAFLSLDNDISSEAFSFNESEINSETIGVAMSGAVVCVAHIDGSHLHIANTGDCRAVLGVLSEDNDWLAKELTHDHTAENIDEVRRIQQEHPASETRTVISGYRLLNLLAPLRAFGDVRLKWSVEALKKVESVEKVVSYFGQNIILPDYHTPPYLTAKPEITHHRLTSRDKFLIIASDGLWDELTSSEAVRLVGEHMRGKIGLSPFSIPEKNMKLQEIFNLLRQRKECFNVKPIDVNAATHLFRNIFSSPELDLRHSNLWKLALKKSSARWFRDDMTVTIIFFDSRYWRQVHH